MSINNYKTVPFTEHVNHLYITANRRRSNLYAETAKPTQTLPSILLPQQLLLELTRAICQQLAELPDGAVCLCGCGFKYQP
jgi:hypothetical protein